MVPLLLPQRLEPRLEVEAPRDRRRLERRLDARLHALEAAQVEVGAAREALDRLTRPPESSAPPPPEGYKEGEREGLEDLIRKSQ